MAKKKAPKPVDHAAKMEEAIRKAVSEYSQANGLDDMDELGWSQMVAEALSGYAVGIEMRISELEADIEEID